jgi:2-phospho-L-lactate guanylyltransferase (CobY/MobA/RfbA family)
VSDEHKNDAVLTEAVPKKDEGSMTIVYASFGIVFVLGVLAIFNMGHIKAMLHGTPSISADTLPSSKVVVIDSRKLVQNSYMKIMADKSMTPDKAKQQGEDFANNLNIVLKQYQDAGVVVISSGVALAYPSNVDITKDVAKKLGVAID